MPQEITLIEAIKLEIAFVQNQYNQAVETGKPISELKVIQDRINYLKKILHNIRTRYTTFERRDKN